MDDEETKPQEGEETKEQEEPKTFDADYVKQLRAENAKYRTERNTLLAEKKAAEQEKLTKEEQAAQKLKEIDEREKQLTERTRAMALKSAVVTAGAGKIASVEAALKLLDTETVQFDDENNPVGVETAVAKLLKDYPFLATSTPTSGDKTNPERNNRGRLTLDDVRKMSPEQINSRWDEVQAVMSGN